MLQQLPPNGGDVFTISMVPADVGKPTANSPAITKLEKLMRKSIVLLSPRVLRFLMLLEKFLLIFHVMLRLQSPLLFLCFLKMQNPKVYYMLVSVQRVQDQREVDARENVNDDSNNTRAQFSNGDIKESIQSDPSEDQRVLSDNISRNHGTSIRSDITLSGSDSSSGLDTPQEPESKNTKLTHETSTTRIYEEQHQSKSSQWDWLELRWFCTSVHDLSADDSSMISLLREISEEGPPDVVIKKLKDELVMLARQAEVTEMELQTLRKPIVKESKKGVDLSKEVASLKEERNELKHEREKMKAKVKVNGNVLNEGVYPWALVDELKQELNYEKDLNSNLRLQLQKTQESNAEFILAIRDLDEMLESKSKLSTAPKLQEVNSKPETDDNEDQKALEEIVREHSGMKDAYLQEQKLINLYNELELYKRVTPRIFVSNDVLTRVICLHVASIINKGLILTNLESI
ncbi:hypothetical protein HanPI659440_Chr13g0481341 [Helianthus annuus]|nr:hypothetical protein HanPI659440_Chr13g0481341 [Helianthus annuus]